MHASKSHPKIGIILGSGGIRSLAALYTLDFLRQKNIPIELIVGCGGGATLASLFSAGFSIQEIINLMTALFNKKTILQFNYPILLHLIGLHKFYPFKPASSTLLKGKLLLDLYKKTFQDLRLEDLPIKTMIQATDLQTGHGVVVEKGLISDMAYASNALFPFQPSIKINDQHLVAGCYTGALPILSILNHHLDIVIVFGFSRNKKAFFTNPVDYYCNFTHESYATKQINHTTLVFLAKEADLILINANFNKGIGIWNSDHVKEILKTSEHIEKIYSLEILEAIKHWYNQEV